MQLYTSHGFMQFLYTAITEADLKKGDLYIKDSLADPFSFGGEEEQRNAALLEKNIKEAIACDDSILEAREKAIDIQKVEQAITDAVKVWAEAAGEFALIRIAKYVRKAAERPAVLRTEWTDVPVVSSCEYLRKTIANYCFASTVSLVGDRVYDRNTGKYAWANIWRTSWNLVTNYNQPGGKHDVIKFVERRFTDLDEAKNYLQGRMDYLSKKYFYTMNPVISLDMRKYFLVHGYEIPGMEYEEQECS